MSVRVSVILQRKGTQVVTISPNATLSSAAQVMAEHNIGALLVSADGRGLEGIISERDLVCQLGRQGVACLERPVAETMTAEVATCSPETTVDELMVTMTDRHIRHLPVLADGAVAGIVSIGDVVKSRLDELEVRAQTMEQYVTGSSS
ncbi:CBS domain-containing protein [soil metagenome]